MLIELEQDDEALIASSSELQKAIRRAVQLTIRNFRANPAPSILSSNTVNGGLDCGTMTESLKKLPVLDELQRTLAANAKDPNDLCRTRS